MNSGKGGSHEKGKCLFKDSGHCRHDSGIAPHPGDDRFRDRRFHPEMQIRGDYMIPGEVFPVVLVGLAAIFWASMREGAFVKPIVWTASVVLFMLVFSQVIAVVSGLANATISEDKAMPWMILVTSMLIVYDLGVMLLGYWGIRLCIHLFKKQPVQPG
jgi:hypothetical protein